MKKIERVWITRGTPNQVKAFFQLVMFLNKLRITNINEFADVRFMDRLP